MLRSRLFHSINEEGKKNSEKVTLGFNIRSIITLTASSKIKRRPVWDQFIQIKRLFIVIYFVE